MVELSKLLANLSLVFSRLSLQVVLVTRVYHFLMALQYSGELLVKYSALESCCCLTDLARIIHVSPDLLMMEYDPDGITLY
jgi:hypothetical protein